MELDPTPGAAGRVVDHDGAERRLVVDAVEPGRRLAWHWWSDDAPDAEQPGGDQPRPHGREGTAVRVVEELRGRHAGAREARAGEAWSHRLLHLEALLLVAAAVRG